MAWSVTDSLPAWAIALTLYAGAAAAAIWWGLRGTVQGGRWGEHLGDLRRRFVISAASLLGVAILLFSFRWDAGPHFALHDSLASQAFNALVADLLPASVQLVVVRPIDGFLAQMTLALGIAAIVTAPIWVSQLAGFILPALKDAEKRAVRNAVLPVAVLFALGAAFAYVYVIPFLLKTLYGYGTALAAQPLLQVSEFIGFTIGLMVVMGLAFQTPVVMVTLTRAGLVEAAAWQRGWRIAVLAIFILSALVTDPTVVSQVLVAIPLMLLYAAGVVAARIKPASR